MKTFRRKGRQFLWMALCQKKAPGQRKLSITAKMHHLPSLTFVERNEILVPLENLIVSWEQHHLAWQKLMDKQDLTVPPLNLQQFPSLKMCWGISRTITDYLQVVWSLNVSENVWFFSVPSMRNRSKDGLHGRCTPHGLSYLTLMLLASYTCAGECS